MSAETIRRLLAMHPAGLSSHQLLWRLRSGGWRAPVNDLIVNLRTLGESGEVIADRAGRWHLAYRPTTVRGIPADRREGSSDSSAEPTPWLHACPAVVIPKSSAPVDLQSDTDDGSGDDDWPTLLSYYAATQRQDPRGRVDERMDRHGRSWQLLQMEGAWWVPGAIRLRMDDLADTFRQALARRPEGVCSLGYPVSVFRHQGQHAVVPGLLVAARYGIAGEYLVCAIDEAEPALNPVFPEIVAGRAGLGRATLVDMLLPEDASADIDAVAARMRNALATLGGSGLRPATLDAAIPAAEQGLRNAAALFLPTDDSFSAGVLRELEALCSWSNATIRGTALGNLLARGTTPSGEAVAPAGPTVLTDSQHAAAADALGHGLTLVQGPPGTGKSALIVTLVASMLQAGQSVLLASRNHQALDEIEARLHDLTCGEALLVRARDRDGERDTNFLEEMRRLAASEPAPSADAVEPGTTVIRATAEAQHESRELARRRATLNLALCEVVERLTRWLEAAPGRALPPPSWYAKLGDLLRRLLHRPADPMSYAALAREAARIRAALAALPPEPSDDVLKSKGEALARAVSDALPLLAARHQRPAAVEIQRIADRVKKLEFDSQGRTPVLSEEDARQVLRYRPVWAVSTLAAAARMPLVPGLFDCVIFDEAGQCDIASALPLLARARRAVVVGDPEQLAFIPRLGRRQEHALMDAAGIGPNGRHRLAQGSNSLFDFVRLRGRARWHFLADQFRSTPEIVAYLNAEFYAGKLRGSQSPGATQVPRGWKAGIAWRDVRGHARRVEGSIANEAEADAVVTLVSELVRDRAYEGTIGVISPFSAQAALLQRNLNATLSAAEHERVQLRVSTIDRFQGGEADVVLVSLAINDAVANGAGGFLGRERRRINVAVSRARALCLVVGDRAFAQRSGIGFLQRLATWEDRPARPRGPFDSDWERRLYEAMRGRGWNPLPQYPVAGRYLDFALDPEKRRLDVEVDGRRWHTDSDGNRKLADHLRDRALTALGWTVRRFWVHELATNMEECLDAIERDLAGR